MEYPDNVKQAVDSGDFGRAKEILGGHISNVGYDRIVLEQYGNVFLLMGDIVNAGRYLFLSGADNPAYEKAVAKYLQRYGGNGWLALGASFPGYVRRTGVSDYPEEVRRVLAAEGMPSDARFAPPAVKNRSESRLKDRLLSIGCILGGALAATALVVGLYQLVKIVASWV